MPGTPEGGNLLRHPLFFEKLIKDARRKYSDIMIFMISARSNGMRKIRIGSGAGFAGDRIDPAIDLIKYGNLDYIGFE